MVKISGRELEALGRGFRQAFFAKVTTEFDDMLSAIDRAHLAAVARLGRLPAPRKAASPDWLIAPVFRSGPGVR